MAAHLLDARGYSRISEDAAILPSRRRSHVNARILNSGGDSFSGDTWTVDRN